MHDGRSGCTLRLSTRTKLSECTSLLSDQFSSPPSSYPAICNSGWAFALSPMLSFLIRGNHGRRNHGGAVDRRLKDLCSAEKQIVRASPELAQAASSPELQQALSAIWKRRKYKSA